MSSQLWWFSLGSLVLATVAGCSDGLARVEGTVLFNGQPVERGSITLEPTDGKGSPAGGDVTNGKFLIEQVQPGPKKVMLYGVKIIGERPIDPDDPKSPKTPDAQELLGPEFNSGSTMTLEVTAPLTTKEFKLEQKK